MDLEPQINKAAAEIKLDTEFKRKHAVILTKKGTQCLSAPPSQEGILLSHCLILGSRLEPCAGAVSVSMLCAPYGKLQAGHQAWVSKSNIKNKSRKVRMSSKNKGISRSQSRININKELVCRS